MAVVTLTSTPIKDAYEPAATAVVDGDRVYEIATADDTTKTFVLDVAEGNQTARFTAGKKFRVRSSTGNDGVYTVVSSVFGAATTIVVTETVVDATDGQAVVGAFQAAATGGNTNDFVGTEHDLVAVRNVHASAAKTFTVPSTANVRGRTGPITAHSLKAGEMVFLPFFKSAGWADADGKIALTGEDANIEFAVLRLPR
jgi:hypothetical protein